jgi:LPXTG-motif cell wall-anchored protein
MNNLNPRSLARKAPFIAVLAMASIGAWAQHTTTTTTRHGESSFDTKVRNAEVVYVEGNDLVLKLENGKVEHLVVPDSDKFTIGGKEVSVHELRAGTKLTQTITTTTVPHYVTTVRALKGKVWHVNAPKSVIVSLPDGTNHAYTVPSHAKFIVNGKPKTVFDLKKGMKFEATIVTDDTENVVTRSKSVKGFEPAPTILPKVGVLLFQLPAPSSENGPAQVALASAEPPAGTLPETGTALPLMGLLGGLALVGSLGVKAVRRKVPA